MKYVMFEIEGKGKFPILFPEEIIHRLLAREIISAAERSYMYGVHAVSAGFVEMEVGEKPSSIMAYGESESLELKSDPSDSENIRIFLNT